MKLLLENWSCHPRFSVGLGMIQLACPQLSLFPYTVLSCANSTITNWSVFKMLLIRSQRSINLWRTSPSCQRSMTAQRPRRITQSASHRLGEPDPSAIPSDAMHSTIDQASMVTVEEASAALPSTYKPGHQPDRNVKPDYATSYAPADLCCGVFCG